MVSTLTLKVLQYKLTLPCWVCNSCICCCCLSFRWCFMCPVSWKDKWTRWPVIHHRQKHRLFDNMNLSLQASDIVHDLTAWVKAVGRSFSHAHYFRFTLFAFMCVSLCIPCVRAHTQAHSLGAAAVLCGYLLFMWHLFRGANAAEPFNSQTGRRTLSAARKQ